MVIVRLKLANMAYNIIRDYEKLAGTEFYKEVIRKCNPNPKIVSLDQLKAWRGFRERILMIPCFIGTETTLAGAFRVSST